MAAADDIGKAHFGTSVVSPFGAPASRQSFGLLEVLYGDECMCQIFSEGRTILSWLEAEVALARAQASAGVFSSEIAEQVAGAAVLSNIDRSTLWTETRNVGYPILPLVRMIAATLPNGANGRVHYGATTQDIMDTGLALQLGEALAHLEALIGDLGDAVAVHVDGHRNTVVAARTHAQQAVPTTLGAKFGVVLAQLARHLERLQQLRPRVCVVSLFGAGGTSAALGPDAAEIRSAMARQLNLGNVDVPWHVARDGIAEFGLLCATVSATCARLAREVIDLSRTEVGEVREADGHHRGASSTMPQKENPIGSEAIVGMAATSGALASALFRALEAGHERAAGEWQIEWQVVPQLAVLAAGCLKVGADVVQGLRIFPDVMRNNLSADGGFVMAEAQMMRLAHDFGREVAHDLVYAAVQISRNTGLTLDAALQQTLPAGPGGTLHAHQQVLPEEYLGSTDAVCDSALSMWHSRRTA